MDFVNPFFSFIDGAYQIFLKKTVLNATDADHQFLNIFCVNGLKRNAIDVNVNHLVSAFQNCLSAQWRPKL